MRLKIRGIIIENVPVEEAITLIERYGTRGESMIADRKITSAPGAAIELTEITLTPEAKQALTITGGAKIPPAH
jgi:hypothetical protein